MPQQNLDRSEVASSLVDDRRLRSAQRMRSIFVRWQADRGDPFIDEAGILSGAQVTGSIDPAWKCEVVNAAASPFEPGEQAGSRIGGDFELNWSSRFLLDDHRSRADGGSRHKRADFDFDQVAAPELAVQRQVEESSISHPTFTIKKEADRPNLFDLQSAFSANLPAGVPRWPSCSSRIIL